MIQKQMETTSGEKPARSTAKIVQCVCKYKSTVKVWDLEYNEVKNARSILDVMMVGACRGTNIVFCAEGPDEKEVIEELELLFKNNFYL